MSRVFRRGELKVALLHVLAATGPANGYTIMQRLADEVGGGWRASPGAIYPALLALEDAGQITSRDEAGSRVYSLTPAGRRACDDRPDVLGAVAVRAAEGEPTTTLGRVLDGFARHGADRTRTLGPDQRQAVESILAAAAERISDLLDKEHVHDR